MDTITLCAIAVASSINSAMPGPCVALTMGRSAKAGADAGMTVSIGILAAKLILVTSALAIISGSFALSPEAYQIIKWVGAAALAWLAVRIFVSRSGSGKLQVITAYSRLRDLSSGLIVGLSSPFNLVFLIALLPQFVDAQTLDLKAALAITAAIFIGALMSQYVVSWLGAASGKIPSLGNTVELLGAVAMLGFAVIAVITPIS